MEASKIVDENGKILNIVDIMAHAVQYSEYIDKMGEKLGQICDEKIQGLLNDKKYLEAKKVVREFFKPSFYNGSSIFVEYDLIIARINQLEK